MKRLLLLVLLAGCEPSTEPALPLAVVGYYQLVSIDGHPLPYPTYPPGVIGVVTIGGGLTIGSDSGWTVADTSTSFTFDTFRWGGVVIPNPEDATRYTFKDSSHVGVRYTGTTSGQVFTLVGQDRTYRYQRKP